MTIQTKKRIKYKILSYLGYYLQNFILKSFSPICGLADLNSHRRKARYQIDEFSIILIFQRMSAAM